MALNLYLNFDGNCREAVLFYSEVFQTGEPQILTFAQGHTDLEHPLPEDAKNRVMHTRLDIAGTTLMCSDTFPGMPFVAGNNFSLTIVNSDIEEVKSLFAKLKVGGKVSMDLSETFFSKCYGAITDQFGIQWQLLHQND